MRDVLWIIAMAILVAWNSATCYAHIKTGDVLWVMVDSFLILWCLVIAHVHISSLTETKGEDNVGNKES